MGAAYYRFLVTHLQEGGFALPGAHSDRLILVEVSDLSRHATAFLVDRQARGLSLSTVTFYASALRALQRYLEQWGILAPRRLKVEHLRTHLLRISWRRNAGTVHAIRRFGIGQTIQSRL